jgi:hypothetical protein
MIERRIIQRKLKRPKKEHKIGVTLRFTEDEFEFLHEVKEKMGCTISGYLRFLIHRSTYEEREMSSIGRNRKATKTVSLLLHCKNLTKTYRFLVSESERNELERVKTERGINFNTQIRFLIRRRMSEWDKLEGELYEVV